MLRVPEKAALEIRRQLVRGVEPAHRIRIREPSLLAVRSRDPAEEVIERSVLHHQHDDVAEVTRSALCVLARLPPKRRDGGLLRFRRTGVGCAGKGEYEEDCGACEADDHCKPPGSASARTLCTRRPPGRDFDVTTGSREISVRSGVRELCPKVNGLRQRSSPEGRT